MIYIEKKIDLMSQFFKFRIFPNTPSLFNTNINKNVIKKFNNNNNINYFTQYETRDSFMNSFSNKKDNLKFCKPDTYIIPETNKTFLNIPRDHQYESQDF
jgi:hypothetical protein